MWPVQTRVQEHKILFNKHDKENITYAKISHFTYSFFEGEELKVRSEWIFKEGKYFWILKEG